MRFPRLPKKSGISKAVYLTRDSELGKSSFLTSRTHSEKVVDFASLSENDHVCELGAGFGVLSQEILRKGVKSLLSVEWNRMCIMHLSKFPKYNNNHIVKHGDPFFLDFENEFENISDHPLTIFANFPLFERNYIYVDQMLDDLALKQQAFCSPKTKIITFLEIKKAQRICGNVHIPGRLPELLIQNFFKTDLGPKITRQAFTDITVSDCHAVLLEPLPRPVMDIELSKLRQLIYCLSGAAPFYMSKRTIDQNLRLSGVLNSENQSELFAACEANGLDLNKEQKDLTFLDILKYVNATLNYLPEEEVPRISDENNE